MANQYKKANKFSDQLTVAQAAVEWQSLSREQQELVIVEDGIPYLAGVPELTERAEALANAAGRRKITGLTHTEDGAPLPLRNVILDRESVRAWTAKVQASLPPELPEVKTKNAGTPQVEEQLLRLNDVLEILGIGRSTLYRRIEAKQFDKAHFENPARWRKSYVLALMKCSNVDESEI